MDIIEKIDNSLMDMVLEGIDDIGSDTKKEIKTQVRKLTSMPAKKLEKNTKKHFLEMVKRAKKEGKEKDVLASINKAFNTRYKRLDDITKMNVNERIEYDDSVNYYKFMANVKRATIDVSAVIIAAMGIALAFAITGALSIFVIIGAVVFIGLVVSINHYIPYAAIEYHADVEKFKVSHNPAKS